MRSVYLAAIAAAVLAGGGFTSAAQAAAPALPGLPTEGVVCFIEFRYGSGTGLVDNMPIKELGGIPVGVRCIAFGREIEPEGPLCEVCSALVIDYGVDTRAQGFLSDGFALLDDAARAVDPVSAGRSREAARDRFLAVAGALPTEAPVVRATGVLDATSGVFVASAHLAGAGAGIDAGLGRLAGIDPDGDPAIQIEQGMGRMGEAYERMVRGM
jgi:hypothetical protein